MMLVHLATSDDVNEAGMTLAEVTFRRLLRLITMGELSPGADVAEEKLSVVLNVSRTPLRDAIRRLESLGLLVRRTNRTLVVPELTSEEMTDLSLTREALETLVVKRVAQRAGAGEIDLGRLQEIHARLKRAGPKGDRHSLETGLAFHREMYRLAKVPSAVNLLDQIALRLERYRQLTKGHARRAQEVLREHEDILNAICKGDDVEAERAMHLHLRRARDTYSKLLSKHR